jgi:hypothetical protein
MEQLPSANLWKAVALFVFYLTTLLETQTKQRQMK